MPYADATQARAFYAGEDTSGVALSVPMNLAARIVANNSLTPDPLTDDYVEAARDAELLVGKYIFTTGGFMQGATLSGTGSVTFASDPKVLSLVASAMGEFYLPSGSSANVAYTSRF